MSNNGIKGFMMKASLGLMGLLMTPIGPNIDYAAQSQLAMKHRLENILDKESEELIAAKRAELEKYNSLVKYALSQSLEKNVILINKSEYTLDILRDSQILRRHYIELGHNPVDDKQMEGDACTPEGIYAAAAKIPEQHSSFYKAILINYPTAENYASFNEKKASGVLPEYATIGGQVEIHGCGSGNRGNKAGRNWTLGCVAASDQDMDFIYEQVKIGTPIIIVKYTTDKYDKEYIVKYTTDKYDKEYN